MTIRSLARRGAALALSAALALTAPAWAAPQDDWQTLYKGEMRRLLTQGAAGPQSLFAVLADLNLDGAPELFTLSSDGLTQRQYTAGEGRLSPLAMEEGEDWGGRQLQNLRLYFNSQTGQYKLTAEYSHSAENGFSASGGISLYEYSLEGQTLRRQLQFQYMEASEGAAYYCVGEDSELVSLSGSQYRKKMDDYYQGFSLISDYAPSVFALSVGYDEAQVDRMLKNYRPCPVQALPAQTPVLVGDVQISFDIYNIGGSSYFKLRDLAQALSGSAKQFNVGWDNESRQVSIEVGKVYQPAVGAAGEPLSVVPALGRQPSDGGVSFGGRPFEAEKYNIGGSNYFKLRDLAQLLDFQVLWDEASRSIQIDPSKPYTP